MSEINQDPAKPTVDPDEAKPPIADPTGNPDDSKNNEGLVNKNRELLDKLKKTEGRLSKFEQAVVDQKTQTLKDNEKWKELSEVKESENTKLRKTIEDNALELVALQNGFNHSSDILQFRDRFTFKDGKVENVKEVIDELKKDRGYFFGKPNAQVPNTTGDTPPAYTPSGDVITLAEMNRRKKLPGYVAWYTKHEEEIQNLATAGRLK